MWEFPKLGYYKGSFKGLYKVYGFRKLGTIRVPLKGSIRFRVSENWGYLIWGCLE